MLSSHTQISQRDKDIILQELTGMKDSIEHILQILGEEEIDRKWRLFQAMHNEGGIVQRNRWHELGREYGYNDMRGLAGLTAFGKWITRVAGDKFALTNDAIEELRRRGLIE